jgi:hypothetical protein
MEMSKNYIMTSGRSEIGFAPENGAVIALWKKNIQLLEPAMELFSLSLLDGNGNSTMVKSSDFKFSFRKVSETGAVLHYDCHAVFPKFEVNVAVRGGGDAFYFQAEVKNIPDALRLEWIDTPQIFINNSGKLFWPFYDGCEVSDFSNREDSAWSDYRPVGYTPRRKACGGLYPGHSQMQFLAYYRDGHGVYFGAHDPKHTPKATEYDYMDEKSTRLSLQTFCGEAENRHYKSGFEYVLLPYEGEWMEGCEIYRDWIKTLPEFQKPVERPDWMKNSPVNLIYPVRGDGDDKGKMQANEYFPYISAMPVVEKYARLFDSQIMSLLMHWEGTAPWAPPYVWPPFGGEEALAAYRDALHKKGHLLGVYCSGTAWTQKSCINDYSQEERCEKEGLARYMMRGPHGQLEAAICNGLESQRLGYDLCLTEDWSRNTICAEVRKLAELDLDYCQFFDQNIGGGAQVCYSPEHHHPSIPGTWQTEAMKSLQDRMIREIKECGSKMILGCEASAATPYVTNLIYNDSRPGAGYGFGRPLPGISFVFHEYMCNFSGNQISHQSDPLYRLAYSFHMGDMLSVVLGKDGKMVMAWGIKWDKPLPEQQPLSDLMRSLNALRKKYPQFLLSGMMIKPFASIEAKKNVLHLSGRDVEIEGVLSSFWQDADGNRIGFATNYLNEKQTVKIEYSDGRSEEKDLLPLSTITMLWSVVK